MLKGPSRGGAENPFVLPRNFIFYNFSLCTDCNESFLLFTAQLVKALGWSASEPAYPPSKIRFTKWLDGAHMCAPIQVPRRTASISVSGFFTLHLFHFVLCCVVVTVLFVCLFFPLSPFPSLLFDIYFVNNKYFLLDLLDNCP